MVHPEFDLEEELKKLPDKPGVYIMHGQADEILYVGKAVVLKNRVRSYFQPGYKRTAKINAMVKQVSRFEYIITDSEVEALVLECNLIKEHRPKYNTMLKDDKGYPYIRLTRQEPFPRIQYAHQMKKDKARYFGPYPNAGAVKEMLELIHRLFMLRTCNRNLPRDEGKERPCLNYHLHQCSAPCQGYISQEEYQKQIDQAVELLEGHTAPLIRTLKKKMEEAAEDLRFEEAASLRDSITAIESLATRQKMTASDSQKNMDVVAIAREGGDAVCVVFFVREGKMIGREHKHLLIDEEETNGEILGDFVNQYYAGTPFIPGTLLVAEAFPDMKLTEDFLSEKRGGRLTLKVPQKGQNEKLLELAGKNAKLILSNDKEKLRREEARTAGAMRDLEKLLGLSGLSRAESFDISHTSGFASVGSMVVYEEGRPKRSDYRKFKIRYVEGVDDAASMREVLYRRFSESLAGNVAFSKLPDILLMDGGSIQVHAAEEVLEGLGLSIPVCGMVKDDRHRTRALLYREKECPIDRHSELFMLLTRIQDEVHRFAIEYHRSLRTKAQSRSILEEIPGIGKKRRIALMRAFDSLEALKKATAQELLAIPEMNEASVKSVMNFFENNFTESAD